MQLFFDATLSTEFKTHLINEDESKHILRVLRKKIGDPIKITNGMGCLFDAEIIDIKSKRCEIKCIKKTHENPLPYQLHIAIAPTKSSDRFEFFLEKATEIGITEITPLLCKNNERKRLNISRCEKILESAMKQSQRLFLPKLHEMISYDKFLKSIGKDYQKYIAHCEDKHKYHLTDKLQNTQKHCVLIGPEGDFSPDEIKMALLENFQPISLGNKRLRTETAGITVCQAFALHHKI